MVSVILLFLLSLTAPFPTPGEHLWMFGGNVSVSSYDEYVWIDPLLCATPRLDADAINDCGCWYVDRAWLASGVL